MFQISKLLFPLNPLYSCKIFHNAESFNKSINQKSLKWRFLDPLCLSWLKISEIRNWNCRYDSQFILNSRKLINLKSCFDPFLFIQNVFLQQINFRYRHHLYNWSQDNGFDKHWSAEFLLTVFLRLCFHALPNELFCTRRKIFQRLCCT